MVKVVGITGGIATGKSTVTKMLRNHGYTVLDADVMSHDAYLPGSETFKKITASFDCLENGVISRKKLGQIVFSDEAKRKELEAIIHPYVYQRMEEGIKKASGSLIFLDVPLLFEAHFDRLCNAVIVVTCAPDIELSRFMARNHLGKEASICRIKSQMPLSEKEKRADYVIDNSGDRYHLQSQVKRVLGELRHV